MYVALFVIAMAAGGFVEISGMDHFASRGKAGQGTVQRKVGAS